MGVFILLTLSACMNHNPKIIEAFAFAAERHKHQRRKGRRNIPYINHPIGVAALLSKFGEDGPDLIISALLHDLIEDTTKNESEIRELSDIIKEKFGKSVLSIVLEVSDDKNMSVKQRKQLQVEHTPGLSDSAKKLKIADKTCNLLDVINDPPINWTRKRKIKYLEWSKQVVDGARGLNLKLDQYFDRVCKEVQQKLLKNKRL